MENMGMKFSETQKMSTFFCDKLREKFTNKVDDFVISDMIDDPNHRSFSITFTAYDYFPIRMNYDMGRFGCCTSYEKRGIGLKNSRKWWDSANFYIF